jgi:hypothetical protein
MQRSVQTIRPHQPIRDWRRKPGHDEFAGASGHRREAGPGPPRDEPQALELGTRSHALNRFASFWPFAVCDFF